MKDELKNVRKSKLSKIQSAGLMPYPQTTKRTHAIANALKDFNSLAKSKKEVFLVGRIKSQREHGKATFLQIEDGSGAIQVFLRENGLGKNKYQFFLDIFDVGDFVQIKGILFKTKRGEKTIDAKDYKILTKSLLPLPEKWHGLKDEEERYRKRYLDLIFNKEVRQKFETKTKIIKALRDFLDNEGFLEMETSVLQSIYGGAEAKPFKTKINAFGLEVYLRIALELDLKKLIVGGFEKVYEIGRIFRNEGVDRMHNPDFTMLEFYWAYADYKDLMKLTEKMFLYILKKVFNSKKIVYSGKEINFSSPWSRVEYHELIKKYTKIDIDELNRDAMFKKAKELDVVVGKNDSKSKIIDEIYKKYCRPKIWEPTFVIHHPTGSKPLAKPLDDNSSKLGSFQLVLANGWELINAYSELNDPLLQRQIFEEQEKYFEKGMEEAQRMDHDFLEALEYGMPPTAGFGMGIDRLTALLTDSHNLREVILFPTMKPKKNE